MRRKILVSTADIGSDYDDYSNFDPIGVNFRFHEKYYEQKKFDEHIILSIPTVLLDDDVVSSDENGVISVTDYSKVNYNHSDAIAVVDELRRLYPNRSINLIETQLDRNETTASDYREFLESFVRLRSGDNTYFLFHDGCDFPERVVHYINDQYASGFQIIRSMYRYLYKYFPDDPDARDVMFTTEMFNYGINNSIEDQDSSFMDENDYLFTTVNSLSHSAKSDSSNYSDDKALRLEDCKITGSIIPTYERALKTAKTYDATVLILGETGTGKEHLAKFIHDNSQRKNKPYRTINCSAFHDSLLESRLFGHKKGSFTGADKDHQGLFMQSNGGTIFLDEIGDISSYMQQSLLRVIQEKEVTPIGGNPIKVDIRVITATNKNLHQMCTDGKFRWDLYHRLNVAQLNLPPLRDRGRDEINELIEYLVIKKKDQFGRHKPILLNGKVTDWLIRYDYPGNIRELANIIEQFYTFAGEEVNLQDIPRDKFDTDPTHPIKLLDVEKDHVKKILIRNNYNKSRTAEDLGIGRNTLDDKIKKYKIVVPERV